jgi:hypothetical protein
VSLNTITPLLQTDPIPMSTTANYWSRYIIIQYTSYLHISYEMEPVILNQWCPLRFPAEKLVILDTQDEDKQNKNTTTYVLDITIRKQTNTNSINTTLAVLQTTGGKCIVLCGNRNGHHWFKITDNVLSYTTYIYTFNIHTIPMWPPRYNWNIDESVVKYHNPTPPNRPHSHVYHGKLLKPIHHLLVCMNTMNRKYTINLPLNIVRIMYTIHVWIKWRRVLFYPFLLYSLYLLIKVNGSSAFIWV